MIRLACVLVFAYALAGCFDSDFGTEPSRGELGVVELSWEEDGFGCLFGCNAKEPVATGSTAELHVENAGMLPPYTVRVDDPAIASVSGTSRVQVSGLLAGTVRLVFEEVSSGALLDTFPVKVADVDRVKPSGEILLYMIGSAEVEFDVYDASGRRLVGVGALSFMPSPSLDMGQLDLSGCPDIDHAECVHLLGLDVGIGLLEIEAVTGAMQGIPLEIVDDTAITGIRLSKERYSDRVDVRHTALSGKQTVLGTSCSWSITSSDLLFFSSESGERVTVRSPFDGGTGTVTCRIGSTVARVDVRI